ncbi:VOC family protein [Nocardia blacklockiae]|uniref:VOC family protein n=1 Tax=Nocardia blacklockiae TaxID=480036 RepID=UPI0018949B96|nr:VOC family protein [Nocardia blacklockiae]MBF6170901.1 VOC family protein [Nocardia blacklockiae]
MTPAFDTVAWFQVGTADPAAAQRFYGELFGWTFRTDPGSGEGYDLVSYADSRIPSGGIAHLDESDTPHAVFCVVVRDVAATTTRALDLGAKVLVPAVTTPDGLTFAHLLDADGNRFMVFTPAPA